jgi:hypothetical protein
MVTVTTVLSMKVQVMSLVLLLSGFMVLVFGLFVCLGNES